VTKTSRKILPNMAATVVLSALGCTGGCTIHGDPPLPPIVCPAADAGNLLETQWLMDGATTLQVISGYIQRRAEFDATATTSSSASTNRTTRSA
jgi:hypothetical protein